VSFYYSVSSLSVLSNSRIPGLTPLEKPERPPDLVVFLGSCPAANDGLMSGPEATLTYVSTARDSMGEPMLKVWELGNGAYLRVAYCDGTQFWFDRRGTKLWATWPEDSCAENTSLYLLGPILALVLRYRGLVCLHASAVVVNGRAVAFVGPEEAGKSTTAAAFSRKGSAILSDDVVPLREQDGAFFALPGSPHLRLWPESVELLFGSRDMLPRLVSDWEKRLLSDGDQQSKFWQQACELHSIYILKPRRGDLGLPRLETVDQQTALMSLVANSYASPLIDSKMQGDELQFLARLVSHVPIRQLSPHADGARLTELCDLVCEDLSVSRHKH
jgi:hypothetical protein